MTGKSEHKDRGLEAGSEEFIGQGDGSGGGGEDAGFGI